MKETEKIVLIGGVGAVSALIVKGVGKVCSETLEVYKNETELEAKKSIVSGLAVAISAVVGGTAYVVGKMMERL